MTDSWIVELFDKNKHDRNGFCCGQEQLDTYFQHHAAQDVKKSLTALYVIADKSDQNKVLGYFTLSSAVIAFDEIPDTYSKKLPRYPIPAIRLGRLALTKEMQGKGFGDILLADAETRARDMQRQLGIWALTVDAKNDALADWYKDYGFIALPNDPLKLFLKLN